MTLGFKINPRLRARSNYVLTFPARHPSLENTELSDFDGVRQKRFWMAKSLAEDLSALIGVWHSNVSTRFVVSQITAARTPPQGVTYSFVAVPRRAVAMWRSVCASASA